VNDGKGSYSCLCPIGYYSDTAADGQSTCSFGKCTCTAGGAAGGDLLPHLSRLQHHRSSSLLTQNPGLNCSDLRPGQVVNTTSPAFACAVAYTVTSDYNTFNGIADVVLQPPSQRWPPLPPSPQQSLKALNPTAICSADGKLAKGQVICLQAGTWEGYPTCNQLYTLQAQDTCISMTDNFFPLDPIPFYGMNPGLDCGVVADPSPGVGGSLGTTGITVCIGAEPVGARVCPTVTTLKRPSVKTILYVGKKGRQLLVRPQHTLQEVQGHYSVQ